LAKGAFGETSIFVGGTVDFGALAGATNFAKMLAKKGCPHMESI
jgi:hypothetical protein